MSTTIESLELEIQSNSKSAVSGIDALTSSLGKLKSAIGGGLGLTSLAKQLGSVSSAAKNIDSSATTNITGLARAIRVLGNSKISSSIANQLKAISTSLQTADFSSGKAKIEELVNALSPLATMAKTNFGSYVSNLKKLPTIINELNKVDMAALKTKVQELADAFKPLGDEMQKVANGFSAFPSKIQKLLNVTNQIPGANKKAAKSFTDLWYKAKSALSVVVNVGKAILSTVRQASDYRESLNLLAVSMSGTKTMDDGTLKKYSELAHETALKYEDALGIDSNEWMKSQGVFNVMAEGFGIASDRAYDMSTNLTQLGYDLASLENLSVEDAMLKLKSGLAGELEPLRAIGYDLSQAKLEATALELGITKSVSSMTQAEKAQLRYYAIMTQITAAHGDFARTIDEPANQLKRLESTFNVLTREIGNLFVPILQDVILPNLIAILKVSTEIVRVFGKLFGIEAASLPDATKQTAEGASAITESLEESTEEAKKLKSYMLGFDELNVINPNSGSETDPSGWKDFELPTYNFMEDYNGNQIDEIVDGMREWLGINKEISSWSDLLDTRFGHILITVGAIAVALIGWKVIMGIVGIVTAIGTAFSSLASLFGSKATGGTNLLKSDVNIKHTDIDQISSGISETTTKLKGLVKNLALGIVVILEVIVAVGLVVAAIWGLGVLLEQVGIAWQPVIDNGATVAIAMGIGTALIVAIGVATALLGNLGGAVCGQIAIGIAILAELGVAAILFIAEILIIGKLLDEVGKAWQPVIDNGETIALGIAIGTGLLVGIGVVSAALGVATVASVGLLPLAIALGTAMLVMLEKEFVLFAESLVVVANTLSEQLHPSLARTSEILPPLTDNMRQFVDFMGAFAWEMVRYSANSTISGIAGTIDTIVKFFTQDPIEKMVNEVKHQADQFTRLIKELERAVPKIQRAIELTLQYNTSLSDYASVSGQSSSNGSSNGWFSGISSLFGAAPSVSVSVPAYATGAYGIPTGQMFIAREAGAEMVGSIGRKTAVANNDQIVESISGGVAEANTEQNALLREQNELLRALLAKDNSVYLDGRTVTGSVEKYQRERGRVLITGGVL